VRAQAEQVEQKLALVVGCAAGVQQIAGDRRVERVGVPQLDRVDGLHVVVAINQYRRRGFVISSVGAAPLGVNSRQARGRPDLDNREPGLTRRCGEPVGAAMHVAVVLGLSADARNAQPLVEVG